MNELLQLLRDRYPRQGIAAVRLEGETLVISLARPAMLLGRDGAGYDALCAEVATFRGAKSEVRLEQLARPELEPLLVADDVALKLSRGRAPQELLEIIAQQCLRVGAKGCQLEVSGCISARYECGTLDEQAGHGSAEAVLEPPFEADDDGNPLPPPPQPDPPPKFTVSVRISR